MNWLVATAVILGAAKEPRLTARLDDSVRTPLPRPDVVHGLYVNRWAMLTPKIWHLVHLARTTEVNALVIDVKDDRGLVLYRSRVPLAHQIGADNSSPVPAARLRAVLDTMRANGVHAIARIVVVKDPLLARARPTWSVKTRGSGKPLLDGKGAPWLDAHQREVWQYAADLAEEAVALGFSEVQFDYVRFPDEPKLQREASYAMAQGRSRAQVIREQLGYLKNRMDSIGVPMAIDVFGSTTSVTTDMGIGQKWEMFADKADIVMPMVYPSHYPRGTYGIPVPNAAPYAVIDRALKYGIARNAKIEGAAKIVPWYQDFTLGKPKYGVEQIREQIRAGHDNGIESWVLWNASSRYTEAALGTRAPSETP